jgi:hypothetical protein
MRFLPLGRACFREQHAESEDDAAILGCKASTSQAQPPDVRG